MDSVIECSNLTRTYILKSLFGKKQETVALNGLTFQVPSGIVFGLLGPNGSGKTTTMRILSTLLLPTAGEARILGFDCVKGAAWIRKKIGLILGGDRGLYGRLTGLENLKYFAVLNHLNKEEAKKRVNDVLELVSLTEAATRPVEQYSRGMKQRLHIARGLLTDPDLLFMDEPTIGLDPEGAQELHALIPELIGRGKTIFLTTHYMTEADILSDRIAIIKKGAIVASGTPTEVKRQFSKISVMEVIMRQANLKAKTELSSVLGVKEIAYVLDGPIQKITIYYQPQTDIKDSVVAILGPGNLENVSIRDATLEEAYLSIIK